MPDFLVTAPDGTQLKVTAPEGASHDEVVAYAQKNYTPKEAPAPSDGSPGAGDVLSTIFTHPLDVAKQMGNMTPGQSTTIPYLTSSGQGLYGAVDEAAAGIRGAGAAAKAAFTGDPIADAYSGEYDSSLKNIRQTQQDFAQQNPGAALTGQLATGAIATAPLTGLGAAAPGAGVISQGLNAAKVAAPVGAVTGYMSGEGGAGNRAIEGVKDAALYGATAGVLPAAGSVVAGTARLGGKAIAAVPKTAWEILQDHYAPETAALKRVGAAIGQDAQNGVPLSDVTSAVNRTNMSPSEVGGPNIAALSKDIAAEPGASGPYLASNIQNRMTDQAQNIPDIIKNQLGATGEGTNAIDLAAQRKAAIGPLADKAFADNSAVATDPTIQRLLGNPDVRAGIPRGIRIIRNEADATGQPFNIHDYGLVEANPGVEATQSMQAVPNMRLLDAAKRGLDAQISENSNDFGQLNDLGRTQFLLKNALVSRMKNLSEPYKNYIENAADQFSLANAAKVGRGIWRTQNSEETISQLGAMSQPEKDMALNGAVRSLVEQIQKQPDSANHALTSLSKPYYRELLRPLVGSDQALDQLVSGLQEQATAYARNKSMLGVAQTGLTKQFSDRPKGFKGMLDSLWDRVFNQEEVRNHVGQILFNQNPKESAALLQHASKYAPHAPPQNFVNNPGAMLQKNQPIDYQKFLQPYFQGTNQQGAQQ